MSYILDALRRANSERERGSVPTLHTNPGPADLSMDEDAALRATTARPAGGGATPILIGGAIVLMLLAAGAAWYWSGSEPQQVVAIPAPQPAAPPAPQRAPLPTQTAPAQPPAVAPTAVATVPLNVPALADPVPQPIPPAAAPRPAAATPPPTRDQLPAALRQQLPQLATSGAMYSDTPAQRMVIINGQLLHEGDKVAPDLVLEQIQLKQAVLSYKGQRFTISY